MTWFGESWGAPINEQTEHSRVPVGDRCSHCETVIGSDDQGLIFPLMTLDDWREGTQPPSTPYHLQCALIHLGLGPKDAGYPGT